MHAVHSTQTILEPWCFTFVMISNEHDDLQETEVDKYRHPSA